MFLAERTANAVNSKCVAECIFILLSTGIRSTFDSMLITLLWLLYTYERRYPAPYNIRCVYFPLVWRIIIPSPSCLSSRVWIAIEWQLIIDAVLMTLLAAYRYPSIYAVKCRRCADDAVVSAHVRKRVICTVQLSLCVPPLGVEILPSYLLPSRACLYSKTRCVYSTTVISYVVFTTYAVCTSPSCGEIIFPHACCRADRVCIAIEWISCSWLIYCLRRQILGGERVVFMLLADRMTNAVNRKCAPVQYIFLTLPGYAVNFCRYANHPAVSAIYVL